LGGGGGRSTNSVEDRGRRERGSGGGSPLVRGSAQFANERNPYCDYFVTDIFSTELGIRLSFFKTLEFRWGVLSPQTPLSIRYCLKVMADIFNGNAQK
jgi:hypothetical protein